MTTDPRKAPYLYYTNGMILLYGGFLDKSVSEWCIINQLDYYYVGRHMHLLCMKKEEETLFLIKWSDNIIVKDNWDHSYHNVIDLAQRLYNLYPNR